MQRSIADIIAEHEAARAKRDAMDGPSVPHLGLREELCATLAELDADAAQDDLMFELVNAPCASDDEFFVKCRYILESEATIAGWRYGQGFAPIALAEALRQHLKHREKPEDARP